MLVDLVQTTTRDGVRLDGIYQAPQDKTPRTLGVDGVCFVHGTGGNFYGSTLVDGLAERFLQLGCAVLRINTRGHDVISNAQTAKGGRRLGAAYEAVDDCRADLAAWLDWLTPKAGPRLVLVGHSSGAVKCLYALAREPNLPVAAAIALSPPRLSYSWFCASPEGPEFLKTHQQAEQMVHGGQAAALLDVKLPLPFVVTAAGYVEKYGPDERYNYFRLLPGVKCPTLVTLGSIEVENNMAFRSAPAELAELAKRHPNLQVETIPGGDHFYTGVRDQVVMVIKEWLRTQFATTI